MITLVNASGANASPHVPKLRLGDREFRDFVAVLWLIAIAAVLALANLFISPSASVSTPVTPGVNFATDIAAIHAAYDTVADFSIGSGFVEFEPPPSEPLTTVGFSQATVQAHEHRN
jgi:hypothetical protein